MPDTPTPSPDALIEELLGCLQYARLAATWLRNHADRAHKYDRGYIEEVGTQLAQAEVAADDLASHLRAALAERDEALRWSDAEESQPETAAIKAAFPTRSGKHETYAEAMRLVGARRSKGSLVALVNWLLAERDEAQSKVRWFVERAADEKLDGYRELGARAAKAENERDTALSDVEAMRANWASAVNDIAAFLESCDDSRDDPLAYAAGEVRRRWGSALDARGKHQPKETG